MHKEELVITGLQYSIRWEERDKNLRHIEDMIQTLQRETDVLVLPEMFTTGFSMNPVPFAEKMTGHTINWMMEKSLELDAVVTGSIMVEEFGIYRNRMLWVKPDRTISYYDKRHPFCLIEEGKHFQQGEERGLFEWKGWTFMPSICYDLRFPVWLRNDVYYDVLLNVANWPSIRSFAWKQMIPVRAIENQAYVFAVNRVGHDQLGMNFTGDSIAVSFDGKPLVETTENKEQVFSATLSHSKLRAYRDKYPFLNDRDHFTFRTRTTI